MNIAQHNTVVLDFIQRAKRQCIVSHHISAATGELLALLVISLRAQRVLEIGTLWGYSTWWLAQGVHKQPHGHIITIEKERKHYTLAQQFFAATGLGQVELKLGDACELINTYPAGMFDFIFLDADRRDYTVLLPAIMRILDDGGLLVVDNIMLPADQAMQASLIEFRQQLVQQFNVTTVLLVGQTTLLLALQRGNKIIR